MAAKPFYLGNSLRLPNAVAFLLSAALLCGIFHLVSVHLLVETSERANVKLARSFANALEPLMDDAVGRSQGLNGDQLRAREVTAALRQAVDRQMRGLSILKVKIYNNAGLTVFSTRPSQMGQMKADGKGFQSAVSGQVISELSFRDSVYSLEGTLSDRNVVASYIPIEGPNGNIVSVFEIYDDVTESLATLHYVQRVMYGVIGLVFIVLFGIVVTLTERSQTRLTRKAATTLPDRQATAEG